MHEACVCIERTYPEAHYRNRIWVEKNIIGTLVGPMIDESISVLDEIIGDSERRAEHADANYLKVRLGGCRKKLKRALIASHSGNCRDFYTTFGIFLSSVVELKDKLRRDHVFVKSEDGLYQCCLVLLNLRDYCYA